MSILRTRVPDSTSQDRLSVSKHSISYAFSIPKKNKEGFRSDRLFLKKNYIRTIISSMTLILTMT